MKAILIDDELHCLGTLEILLSKHCPNITIVGKASSGEEGIRLIEQERPHLVFLDIEMPKMNGFEMVDKISTIDFNIIFTTAYDNFAIKAFKVSAVDYLLKPIDKDELVVAVGKVEKFIPGIEHNESINHQLKFLLENLKLSDNKFPNIALPSLSGIEMVKIDDILYLESDGNYTRLFTVDKKEILISKSLKHLEARLTPYDFIRIHHSHCINLRKVKRYVQGDGGYVIMENNLHLNVSRRKKEALLSKLK